MKRNKIPRIVRDEYVPNSMMLGKTQKVIFQLNLKFVHYLREIDI